MNQLPMCRWRSVPIPSIDTAERYACSSPKLIVASVGVDANVCRQCPYLDHEPTAIAVSDRRGIPLPLCVHLGQPAAAPAGADLRRDWRICDRGRGVVCSCHHCQVCPERATLIPDRIHRITFNNSDDPRRVAFNASILRYREQWLLAYRTGWGGGDIHIAMLDQAFNVISTHRIDIPHPRCSYGREDPRLFIFRDQLHCSFAGVWHDGSQGHVDVMVCMLSDDFHVVGVLYPHYKHRSPIEKNWVFFDCDAELYCVYQTHPRHEILKITNEARLVYLTPNQSQWHGGFLRGGASPVRDGDRYIHFFHGWRWSGSYHTYSIGVLAFEARPPFRVTHCSPVPIYAADLSSNPGGHHLDYKSIVFPGGAVRIPGYWIVSYGHHDSYCELAWFHEDDIEQALIPTV
jgi:predicted GH43/DUF377 family glycosyl hydrolase